MKNARTLLLTAVVLVLALGASQLFAQTSQGDFRAIYVGPSNLKSGAGSTFPGFGTGTIGMYAPISGTPCFSCFGLPTGVMAIGPAVAVATAGTGYTWYFTLQTDANTSGNITLIMRLNQNGTLIGQPLQGTLVFNANSVYVVYSTLPVTTPNNPGQAGFLVGLHYGGKVTQALSGPIYIQ
jgi:hypothetical protein